MSNGFLNLRRIILVELIDDWINLKAILPHDGCFNQYHKHQMGIHQRDPMGDYSYSHAHDIWHINYKNHSIIQVHNLHFLLLIAWGQCNQLFEE